MLPLLKSWNALPVFRANWQTCCPGDRKIKVTEALDTWSLGVLAIELLTGDMPLNLQEGADAVRLPISPRTIHPSVTQYNART